MASQLSHTPHFKNIESGFNKYDPVHNSIFEVMFTLPDALAETFRQDEAILTQQVKSISGLDALNKTPAAGEQKFQGVTVSFSQPYLETTAADLTINFNLNLRHVTDNFVLNVFRAWANLSYDLSDGTRTIKPGYISDVLRVAQANRNGEVWRATVFHNVILTGITGLDTLDYSGNDAVDLAVTFRADYWDDALGTGIDENA